MIFEDVLHHQFKERHVFDLAMQAFSPVNIINEIMENTGSFANGRELTTLLLVDDDSSSMMFKNDETNICRHIDSISDQSIVFESNSLTRPYLP